MKGAIYLLTNGQMHSSELESGNNNEMYDRAKDLKRRAEENGIDLDYFSFAVFCVFPSKMNNPDFEPNQQ